MIDVVENLNLNIHQKNTVSRSEAEMTISTMIGLLFHIFSLIIFHITLILHLCTGSVSVQLECHNVVVC